MRAITFLALNAVAIYVAINTRPNPTAEWAQTQLKNNRLDLDLKWNSKCDLPPKGRSTVSEFFYRFFNGAKESIYEIFSAEPSISQAQYLHRAGFSTSEISAILERSYE